MEEAKSEVKEAEFKEVPKTQKPKFSIYNNKIFRHLYSREEISMKRTVDSWGCQVVDEAKHKIYIAQNAKFNFWVLMGFGVLIIYAVISQWMK